MVKDIMQNERRWGHLEARKNIVIDHKSKKVTKNNKTRDSAYDPEHHEGIVTYEIAKAVHMVAASGRGVERRLARSACYQRRSAERFHLRMSYMERHEQPDLAGYLHQRLHQ